MCAAAAGSIQARYIINTTTHKLPAEFQQPTYVTIPLAGKVTAATAKKFIGDKLGISPEHISLKWGKDYVVYSMYMGREDRTALQKGELDGDQEVPQTGCEYPVHWDMNKYTETWVQFCVERCATRSHCPDMVKIDGMFGEVAKLPFSPETTVGEIKMALGVKAQCGPEFVRLVLGETSLENDSQTLGELRLTDGSTILFMKLRPDYYTNP
jgi:hypothetical protein